MDKIIQEPLFDAKVEEEWKKEWEGMPEFFQEDKKPFQKITINFECKEDVIAFSKLIGKKLTYKTDSIWFPLKVNEVVKSKIYVSES